MGEEDDDHETKFTIHVRDADNILSIFRIVDSLINRRSGRTKCNGGGSYRLMRVAGKQANIVENNYGRVVE